MQYVLTPASKVIHPYATWSGAFNSDQLNTLQEIARNAKTQAQVGGGGGGIVNPDIRRSNVSWVENNPDTFWIYKTLGEVASSLNADYFGFDLVGFGELLQFTKYEHGELGTYGWHQDFGGKSVSRKLSLVVQLTDPSQYEGGNLELLLSGSPTVMPKERGLITAFPSWTLHQVTPVTAGYRETIVAWISGPNFV